MSSNGQPLLQPLGRHLRSIGSRKIHGREHGAGEVSSSHEMERLGDDAETTKGRSAWGELLFSDNRAVCGTTGCRRVSRVQTVCGELVRHAAKSSNGWTCGRKADTFRDRCGGDTCRFGTASGRADNLCQ